MEIRSYWLDLIDQTWKRRSVIWLSGVRRVGKTTLTRCIKDAVYFDCERPSDRAVLHDPELFLEEYKGQRLIIDEIHRLDNPSELLKIAADYYKQTRIVATGSSTVTASKKFHDSLTGRKHSIWLTPMNSCDLLDFSATNYSKRLLHGGLPSFFMEPTLVLREYREWIDSYWAKDIQELFNIQKKSSFIKCFESVLANSGTVFEATRYAAQCEVARSTIASYINVMEETFVLHVVRPFSRYKATEIVSAPKVYGFDTGFVAYLKGWHSLRSEDKELLWEHIVLNEVYSKLQQRSVMYWRTKKGYELDFVVRVPVGGIIAVECKWSDKQAINTKAIAAFLTHYPDAQVYVVAHNTARTYQTHSGAHVITHCNLAAFSEKLNQWVE